MEQGSLDAIVATSSQQVVFLSGYGTWLEEKLRGWMLDPAEGSSSQAGFAVLDSSLRGGLVASGLFPEEAESSWATSVVYPERPAASTGRETLDALVSVLKELGLETARLGIEFDGASPHLRQALSMSLPRASIRDCSWLLRLARMHKSPEALRRLDAVKTLTIQALSDAVASAAPDGVALRFREALAASCADLDHIVRGLPTGDGLSLGFAQTRWPAGLVYVDAGARLDHFYCDIGRTVHAQGALSRSDTLHLQIAREALLKGTAALGPGVACSSVLRAMTKAVASTPTLRVQGHGIGLDIRELPIIRSFASASRVRDETLTVSADTVLEPGMVVNLEVSGFYGDGSVQIEETFEIRSAGALALGQGGATDIWELA
jgi:Xaa-Pro aminopeptidase